jgi:hypothetical protein
MTKFLKLFFISFSILLFGCGGDDDFVTQTVEGKFSVELPEYMVELDLENPGALLQFGNEMREHYVIVIMEPHEVLTQLGLNLDLQSYANINLDNMKLALQNPRLEELEDGVKVVNDMQTVGYKLTGLFPESDINIVYYIRYYRSEKSFYAVITWTLEQTERSYLNNMLKIINSLKEI